MTLQEPETSMLRQGWGAISSEPRNRANSSFSPAAASEERWSHAKRDLRKGGRRGRGGGRERRRAPAIGTFRPKQTAGAAIRPAASNRNPGAILPSSQNQAGEHAGKQRVVGISPSICRHPSSHPVLLGLGCEQPAQVGVADGYPRGLDRQRHVVLRYRGNHRRAGFRQRAPHSDIERPGGRA